MMSGSPVGPFNSTKPATVKPSPGRATGPILERDGKRLRILKTSLTEVEDAERLDCADAPLWIVEAEPAD